MTSFIAELFISIHEHMYKQLESFPNFYGMIHSDKITKLQ